MDCGVYQWYCAIFAGREFACFLDARSGVAARVDRWSTAGDLFTVSVFRFRGSFGKTRASVADLFLQSGFIYGCLFFGIAGISVRRVADSSHADVYRLYVGSGAVFLLVALRFRKGKDTFLRWFAVLCGGFPDCCG